VNDQVLAESQTKTGLEKKRLSKRAQKKLNKALANKNTSQIEKQILIDQALGNIPKDFGAGAPVKRQKLSSFRDAKNFISSERPVAT